MPAHQESGSRCKDAVLLMGLWLACARAYKGEEAVNTRAKSRL
ncbi:putative lipoprotein [Shewanella xiamenensis]|nr:putative lipoprotein [Shewanella xiamenensis]